MIRSNLQRNTSLRPTSNCVMCSFIPAGAKAFKRDLQHAEIHLIDAGHFALISNLKDILHFMLPFLHKTLGSGAHHY